MMSNEIRKKIVDAALSFVGTPFRPQGRIPGVALDCLGVAICAGKSAGIHIDEQTPRYKISGVSGAQIEAGKALFEQMEETYKMQPGDIIGWQILGRGRLIHCGIFVGNGWVVHARCDSASKVVHERINAVNMPIVGVFRFKGIE